MGIVIDKVKPGAGTTNTGNVARRFFENPRLTSEITGVDIRLITNLKHMLIALNSGFHIEADLFKELGLNTMKLHVELYSWYKLPQSMHRLFIHAHETIHNCPAAIGQSSEEAIEASHKCFMRALNHHSRMNSYEKMTSDMVHNRLVGTDPIITSYIKKNCG